MNYLYLLLNISSIFVPFVASFHPKLKFYKKWRYLILSMLITNVVFIAWDVWFTKIGVWGFNPDYLIGYNVINLPVEEWMFFICIPYACVFMHYAILELKPKLKIAQNQTTFITYFFIAIFIILIVLTDYID